MRNGGRTARFVSVRSSWVNMRGGYAYPIVEAVRGEVAHLVDGGFCFSDGFG
jgi:hypothetical protein